MISRENSLELEGCRRKTIALRSGRLNEKWRPVTWPCTMGVRRHFYAFLDT